MTPKCAVSGWTDVEVDGHHVGAWVNAPSTTVPVRLDIHLALQQLLRDAGVVHARDYQPSESERLWAVCRGAIDVYTTMFSANGGSPELIESAQTVMFGLGCVLSESDPVSAIGPDPMKAEAWRAWRTRCRRDERPPRFCWGCGKLLDHRRRKWCPECANDPKRDADAYDRTAENARSAPAPAERLSLVLGLGDGLSGDLVGFVESWVTEWLADLGDLGARLADVGPLVDGYAREDELVGVAVGALPLLDCYSREVVNATAVRRPRPVEVLRFIDVVQCFHELFAWTMAILQALARCQTRAQAHAVLDGIIDQGPAHVPVMGA